LALDRKPSIVGGLLPTLGQFFSPVLGTHLDREENLLGGGAGSWGSRTRSDITGMKVLTVLWAVMEPTRETLGDQML
jgi:hypothetical protein